MTETDIVVQALKDVLAWAESRCPCRNEQPNHCPLCGASVENLEACKSAENTLPHALLVKVRRALSNQRGPATMTETDDILARLWAMNLWADLNTGREAWTETHDKAVAHITRLEERCAALTGQVEAGAARITYLEQCCDDNSTQTAELDAEAQAGAAEVERVTKERDEARQIVRDIYWMALRYADGRYSYAVGMVNDAVEKAYAGGWLKHNHKADPEFARGGYSPGWKSIEARADALQAEVERLRAALQDISDGRGVCGTCGTPASGSGAGVTDCGCSYPTWDPQDPAKVARAALHPREPKP